MMKNLYIAGIIMLITGCSYVNKTENEFFKNIYLESPSGKKIEIIAEIADEPSEREMGLMNRTNLAENSGMLFIFSDEAKRSFWMKNTLIPLDIIFFDENKMFVSYSFMIPCDRDPCKQYSSDGDAKYALELPAGSVDEIGIESGWRLINE